jgi:hypothetical protein
LYLFGSLILFTYENIAFWFYWRLKKYKLIKLCKNKY